MLEFKTIKKMKINYNSVLYDTEIVKEQLCDTTTSGGLKVNRENVLGWKTCGCNWYGLFRTLYGCKDQVTVFVLKRENKLYICCCTVAQQLVDKF